MKVGKIIIAGIVTSIVGSIIAMVTCGGFMNWVYALEPTNVWKPMDGPPSAWFYVGTLGINVILAFVYALLRKGIPGKNKIVKGIVFGLCVWAVGIVPGMWATYFFMTVNPAVVLYWLILDVIVLPIKGSIIATIYGE